MCIVPASVIVLTVLFVILNSDGNINTPPMTSPHSCSEGYSPYGSYCYKLNSVEEKQSSAAQACR